MSAVLDPQDVHDHDDHHGPKRGFLRWVFTTNHKDIGAMYLWFSLSMFFVGGLFALVIRSELFEPGLQVEPEFFNQMTTMHGLIMVFGAVMPAFVGLANWMIPVMIGAPDMALPRHEQLVVLAVFHLRSRFCCQPCLWKGRRTLAGRSMRLYPTSYAPLR